MKHEINRAGELIMQAKKDVKAGNPHKYDDTPLYRANSNPREDTGYTRAAIPWKDEALAKVREISPCESPLKQWWIDEQRKKGL